MGIIGISGKIGSGKDTVGKIIQYLTVSDYDGVKDILKERNNRDISIEEHFNSFVERDFKVQWKIKKFADKLKDIVCLLLNCTREQLEDADFKNKELGAEWIRYGRANGFYYHSDGNPSRKIMDNEPCSKKQYEEEVITNWQTAYKLALTPRLLLQVLGTQCGRDIIHPNIWVNATFTSYKPVFNKWDKNGNNMLPNWIITDVRFPNELEAVKDRKGISIRVNRQGYGTSMVALANDHESETALDGTEFDYVLDNFGTIEELIEKVKQILIKEEIL